MCFRNGIHIQCVLTLLIFLATVVNVDATTKTDHARGRNLIINGHNAEQGRYPYTVVIRLGYSFRRFMLCGGSLIAPDVVLSAAHCLPSDGDTFVVSVNPHNLSSTKLNSSSASYESFNPKEYIVHPRYGEGSTGEYDVSMILLPRKSSDTSARVIRLNQDTDLPQPGAQLQSMGWGVWNLTATELPQVLQVRNTTYLSPSKCIHMTRKQRLGQYTDDIINENNMCAYQAGSSNCQNDSGGPLILPGADLNGTEDVQVGIVSWGAGKNCETEPYPGGYTRISHNYDFIRMYVCEKSAEPPTYFECDNHRHTFSPAPSSMTNSPRPTFQQIEILVSIRLDTNPRRLGWRLVREDGLVVRAVNKGTYTTIYINSVAEERLLVDAGKTYAFALDITGGFQGVDASAAVFLGPSKDYERVLAFHSGQFDDSITTKFEISDESTFSMVPPSLSPSVAAFVVPVTITVQIRLSAFTQETGFTIQTAEGQTLHRYSPGVLRNSDGPIYVESFELETNTTYNLFLQDIIGDGFSDDLGFIAVYLGPSVSDDAILAYESGNFGFSKTIQFVTEATGILDNFALNSESPSGSPTISPSLLPTTSPLPTGEQAIIMVSIEMDDAPQQTGWRIESLTSGTVVWEVQSFTYVTEYDVITETLSLDAGTEYDFVLTDSYGDGGPRAIIYFENKSTDNVLAFVDGNFFSESVTRFVASADGIVAFTLFPSTSPSVGPTPNPSIVPSLSRSPTITASPSGPITLVTLHIEFDGFPRETRWELVDHRGRIVQSTQYGEYFLANSTTTEKIYLSSGGTYTIKLFDSAHDGLCCDFGAGHATLFLGEKNGGQILMLHDGRFGSSVSWDFVVSGGALLANVTSFPSMTPLSSSVLPTQTAAPSSLLRTNITVVINLDNLPFETSWSLTTLNGRTLQQGLPGQYIAQGGEIMEVIEVEEDKEYIFQLTDTFGDGICCEYGGGDAAVYLGNEKNAEMMIVKDDGEYGFGRAHNFIASNNETFVAPTLPPSVTKTVITVYIQTDSFLPSETGWYVQSENGRVVRRAQAGDYTRPGEVATLTFPATLGLWHNFTITDSASDGLCCRYGHGFAAVYLGTVMSPEFLLAYDDGQFGAERTHQFMASEEGIIGSTGAPSTTFSPSSVTAPSMSPFVPPPMSSHQPSATLTLSISNPPSVISSSVSRKHMEEMSHIVVILGTIICFVF